MYTASYVFTLYVGGQRQKVDSHQCQQGSVRSRVILTHLQVNPGDLRQYLV